MKIFHPDTNNTFGIMRLTHATIINSVCTLELASKISLKLAKLQKKGDAQEISKAQKHLKIVGTLNGIYNLFFFKGALLKRFIIKENIHFGSSSFKLEISQK